MRTNESQSIQLYASLSWCHMHLAMNAVRNCLKACISCQWRNQNAHHFFGKWSFKETRLDSCILKTRMSIVVSNLSSAGRVRPKQSHFDAYWTILLRPPRSLTCWHTPASDNQSIVASTVLTSSISSVSSSCTPTHKHYTLFLWLAMN